MRKFHAGRGLAWLALAGISVGAAASPALKRTKPATRSAAVAVTSSAQTTATSKEPGKSQPNLSAMLGLIDKLFPPQPDPDPARLGLAQTAVTMMWPNGAYGKMMTGMMGGMFDRAMELKQSDLRGLSGKPPKSDTSAAAGKGLSIHDEAAAKDPHFDQRVAAIRAVLVDEMGRISTIIDPRIRDGLARSMARRFDAQQLTDIDSFFSTPSGHALATQYMQLWFDPDMVRSLFGSLPEMMKLMPEMMQRIKAVEEKFPKPPAAHPQQPARPEKH